MVTKKCSKCRLARPLVQYRKQETSADGHAYECNDCRSARRRARYARDAAYRRKVLDAQRAINAANPERNRAKARAWVIANPDRARETRNKIRQRNIAASNAYQREWAKRNKGTRNAATARRYASKTIATPLWLQRGANAAIYKRAAALGMHVDHIVPLRSRLVCGLHVPWNLQLLSREDNLAKRNHTWPDMP